MTAEKTPPDAESGAVSRRGWLRLGAKTLHDMASISFGGALAACLVINQVASRDTAAEFAAARLAYASIAQYLLVPSMFVVVVSGLIALAATQAYAGAAGPERVRGHAGGRGLETEAGRHRGGLR